MNLQVILGNFALILFVLMVLTGLVWCLDVFYLSKQRRKAADLALAEFDARQSKLAAEGIKSDAGGSRATIEAALLRQPTWVEYSGSFFPVIALVFCLRSFLYEPFKIPSSSWCRPCWWATLSWLTSSPMAFVCRSSTSASLRSTIRSAAT